MRDRLVPDWVVVRRKTLSIRWARCQLHPDSATGVAAKTFVCQGIQHFLAEKTLRHTFGDSGARRPYRLHTREFDVDWRNEVQQVSLGL